MRARILAAALVALTGALAATPSLADALRGKTLYVSTPPTGGAACSTCHGTDPTRNSNKILNGANNAALITSAINGNVGGMGTLRNKWTATDIDDIALYLGNPAVTGAALAQVSPSSIAFAATIVGNAAASQQVTLANAGNASLTLGTLSVGGAQGADFSAQGAGACVAGGVLAAGANCAIGLGFAPTGTGARSATLTITHSAGQSSVALSGTGAAAPQPTISLNQNLLNFGPVTQATSSAPMTIVIGNSGQAPLTLSAMTVSGVAAGIYPLAGSCALNVPIGVGASCTVDVRFAPPAIATYNGALLLSSNASNGTVSVTLQGSGAAVPAPVVSASPAALAFGNQSVGGSSGTQIVTVQNIGNASATLGAPTLAGSTMFSLLDPAACGSSLAVGAVCSLQVQFRPTAAGAQSATLQIGSNAAGSPHQVTLTGTGVTLPTPAPALSQSLPVSFADTTVGQSSSAISAVASNQGSAAYAVSQVMLNGANPGDFVIGGDCSVGKSIATTSSCTMTVRFAPTAVGTRRARANLVTDSGATMGFDLQGVGKAVATTSAQLSSPTVDLGAIAVGGNAAPQRVQLVNTGNQPLSVTAVSAAAPFSLLTDTTTCPAPPFSLAPGLQCALALQFSPTRAGAASATLTVATAAPGPTLTANLIGNGTDTGGKPSVATIATAGTTSAGATAAGATASNAGGADGTGDTPSNLGLGGCTMSRDGNDISTLLLLFAALVTSRWRRLVKRSHDKESS